MGTLYQITLLTLSLFHLSQPQTVSVSTGTSTDDYLHMVVQWGTPPQRFTVAVDTTDHTSWIYGQSANTAQPKFNQALSSTFISFSTSETFSYQGQETTIQFANDTLTIQNNNPIINTEFAVATKNFSITDNETLSGFLCLDRLSTIIPRLYGQQYISNQSVSIDVANNNLYFGPYTPSTSSINNLSNATECSDTRNDELKKIWTFDIQVVIDNVRALSGNSFAGVIDSASPYITIYAESDTKLNSLWKLIDKSSTSTTLNCNYTTRVCNDVNSIMAQMTIVMPDIDWNSSIFREDVIGNENKIQFLYDGDTDYTSDYDYVLFLGRPFLKQLLVTMDYNSPQTLTFYSLKPSSSSLDWITITIVFSCVVAFALIFFGIYCWKYGKIPPPSNNDTEEQVSLLRGPVQAVGSSAQDNGNIQQQFSSGVSGLDEDEMDEEQRQLQQAQRLSAIEAQQRREQQMRVDRERNEAMQMQEQKAQEQMQKADSKKHQRIGSSSAVGNPKDADEIRQRRLKYLEEQQKKQQMDDGD